METLSNELRDIGEKSTISIVKKVYACGAVPTNGTPEVSSRSTIRGVSVGSQFKTSLQSLVADLERTQPHYIRCIKPNLTKSPTKFMAGEVLKQLRYSGMMEAIRIRQEGYALREEHESFFDRFSVLLNPEDMQKGDEAGIVQLVRALSSRLGVSDADWQVGHSKIFLRRELSDKLERLALLRVQCAARNLTRFGKSVVRKRSSTFIAVWASSRLRLRQQRRVYRAASKISASARGYRQRKQYKNLMVSVVKIQCQQRRVAASHRARKMVDPFYDLSYKGCKKLLVSEQSRMEKAIEKQNFTLASELEAKM